MNVNGTLIYSTNIYTSVQMFKIMDLEPTQGSFTADLQVLMMWRDDRLDCRYPFEANETVAPYNWKRITQFVKVKDDMVSDVAFAPLVSLSNMIDLKQSSESQPIFACVPHHIVKLFVPPTAIDWDSDPNAFWGAVAQRFQAQLYSDMNVTRFPYDTQVGAGRKTGPALGAARRCCCGVTVSMCVWVGG